MAKIVGNVVATRKEERLIGQKLMIVQKLDSKLQNIGPEEVAVDYVGAGNGEFVLICEGSGARVTNQNIPIDLAIIGIIDTIDTVN